MASETRRSSLISQLKRSGSLLVWYSIHSIGDRHSIHGTDFISTSHSIGMLLCGIMKALTLPHVTAERMRFYTTSGYSPEEYK
jgi:hypothetical protein